MVNMEKTGELLKELRLANEYSVKDLCEKFSLTHMAIRKWEKGLSLPSIDSLVMISKLYNKPIHELIVIDEKE